MLMIPPTQTLLSAKVLSQVYCINAMFPLRSFKTNILLC